MKQRDDFDTKTKEILAKRASYICSNPDCRCLTIAPSESSELKFIYNGIISHITAASEGGPRYDPSLTPDERKDISNGIFLCANCSIIIDKNNGSDYSVDLLKGWKDQHNSWIKSNINKKISESDVITVDGEHHAEGVGTVTGLDIKKSVKIMPGTKVTAQGIGLITATKIE